MLRCVRTTVTLDDDVAIELERRQTQLGVTFKAALNEALRAGLTALEKPSRLHRTQTRTFDLGECSLPDIDSYADVLALVEGEDHR
jgi:hypothetical protein